MFDIKINKEFIDLDGNEIYVVSMQFGSKFYNLNLTKDEFKKMCDRLRSINDNGGI
jgi:hypothetical protein